MCRDVTLTMPLLLILLPSSFCWACVSKEQAMALQCRARATLQCRWVQQGHNHVPWQRKSFHVHIKLTVE